MGHTDDDDADDLMQLLLAAEQDPEITVDKAASTKTAIKTTKQPIPSLRESDAFGTDLQTGTTASETDDNAPSTSDGVTTASTTPKGKTWMAFSDAAKRSVDRPSQPAESSSAISKPRYEYTYCQRFLLPPLTVNAPSTPSV